MCWRITQVNVQVTKAVNGVARTCGQVVSYPLKDDTFAKTLVWALD
jgi:hypothetical protein